MSRPWSMRRASPIAIALGIVAFIIIWFLFAPTNLGGQAAFVIINGNSMSPIYFKGDLVVLRRIIEPQVGDIVAYRHPEIGPIIHRIIEISGNKFIFKGDNNDWTDSYQPNQTELIGKAWIHIPRLGNAIIWLRQPLVMATLTAIIGGLFMFDLLTGNTRKKVSPHAGTAPSLEWAGGLREVSLFLFTLVGLAGLGLGLLAFSAPETRMVPDNYDYIQTAAFRYTAQADPAVYNAAVVQTGEPIFDKLTCNMDIALVYALNAAKPVDVSGTYRVLARVSEVNGWNRTFELQPRTAFSGGAFNSRVSFNVCEVRNLVNYVMELTGLQRTLFNVAIVAEIDSSGQIGGRDYVSGVTPTLNFGFDNSQLYLLTDEPPQTEPMHWTQTGSLAGMRGVENALSLLGLSIPVRQARLAALIALVAALLGLAAVGIPLFLSVRKDELTGIHAKYAHLIVKIRGQSRPVGASLPVVDVDGIDDLARIAQQTGTLIMENNFANQCQFVVFAHGQCFRYALNTQR